MVLGDEISAGPAWRLLVAFVDTAYVSVVKITSYLHHMVGNAARLACVNIFSPLDVPITHYVLPEQRGC